MAGTRDPPQHRGLVAGARDPLQLLTGARDRSQHAAREGGSRGKEEEEEEEGMWRVVGGMVAGVGEGRWRAEPRLVPALYLCARVSPPLSLCPAPTCSFCPCPARVCSLPLRRTRMPGTEGRRWGGASGKPQGRLRGW